MITLLVVLTLVHLLVWFLSTRYTEKKPYRLYGFLWCGDRYFSVIDFKSFSIQFSTPMESYTLFQVFFIDEPISITIFNMTFLFEKPKIKYKISERR